jgi:hypothetical protein
VIDDLTYTAQRRLAAVEIERERSLDANHAQGIRDEHGPVLAEPAVLRDELLDGLAPRGDA